MDRHSRLEMVEVLRAGLTVVQAEGVTEEVVVVAAVLETCLNLCHSACQGDPHS